MNKNKKIFFLSYLHIFQINGKINLFFCSFLEIMRNWGIFPNLAFFPDKGPFKLHKFQIKWPLTAFFPDFRESSSMKSITYNPEEVLIKEKKRRGGQNPLLKTLFSALKKIFLFFLSDHVSWGIFPTLSLEVSHETETVRILGG